MRLLVIMMSTTLVVLVAGFGVFHQTRSDTGVDFDPSTPLEFVERAATAVDTWSDPYTWWQRPAGPPTVALQVGHWKNNELPDEFERLRESGGGTRGGGKAEWEVALAIAEEAAVLLRAHGFEVEILPATVPPDYWADVFISIHADGNTNSGVSGYKVAAPYRDRTRKADDLAAALEAEYGKIVDLPIDPNISRNMRGYYAFNWRRYVHSMHPMSVGAIVETGFLTNPSDRNILIQQPELPAQGITNGILVFFEQYPPV